MSPTRRHNVAQVKPLARTCTRPRTIDDAPFCWQSKAALWRIREAFDESTFLDQAHAVYLTLCELASDEQSATFDATRRKIAERSGVSIRRVSEILARFKSLNLLDWKQNFLPGTKELAPSTYTLNSVRFFYVYVLQSECYPKNFYVGFTEDLHDRLKTHNSGRVKHTSKPIPWQIKTVVAFTVRNRVIEFERYLKTASGRAFARKRL